MMKCNNFVKARGSSRKLGTLTFHFFARSTKVCCTREYWLHVLGGGGGGVCVCKSHSMDSLLLSMLQKMI